MGGDGYPFDCTTCPQCANTIAIGFIERPICCTRFEVHTFANPEGRKIVDAARCAYYGNTRSDTRAGKLIGTEPKLMKHALRWDNSSAKTEENEWRRSRSAIGATRIRNAHVTNQWVLLP